MHRYIYDPLRMCQTAITDVNNLMLLQSHIHSSFDKAKKFVFLPKNSTTLGSHFVVHLTSFSEEFAILYQNALSYSLDSIPREYLLARFAWAILGKIEIFLLHNVARLLLTASKGEHVAQPEDCKRFTVSRHKRSGTGSPRKRQRPADTPEDDEVGEDYTFPSPHSSDTKVYDSTNSIHDFPLANKDLANLITEALESERKKSDPCGKWRKQSSWAMDTLSTWAMKDVSSEDRYEACLILGIEDDSRAWVEEEN